VPRIIQENPGADFVAIERAEVEVTIKAGRNPDAPENFVQIAMGYDEAKRAAATADADLEFYFGDYNELHIQGAKSMFIAPEPGGFFRSGARKTARTMAENTIVGGNIFVASESRETAKAMANEFELFFGMRINPVEMPRSAVPYESWFLDELSFNNQTHVISFRVPAH
jgi:hypothetical protein